MQATQNRPSCDMLYLNVGYKVSLENSSGIFLCFPKLDLDGATQSLGGLNLLCSARSFTESEADLSSSALNVPISATSVIVVTGQQAAGTCGLAELTEGCCWRVAVPCEEAEQLAAGSESSDERDWGWAWSSPDSGADDPGWRSNICLISFRPFGKCLN